jgi:hypothetical protein|tara:strand:+ start:41 stop:913 length:873 start_codon:yes stop_codon:yes gene_type:complete
MIGVALKKKISALFLNSCFLMPMVLITIVMSIAPTVQAESVCEVPASNSWDVDDRTNYHYLSPSNNFLVENDNELIYEQISQDFSLEINVINDSASAISMALSPGKSYTFCYTYSGDQDSPPTNGAKADVYLMSEGNWDFYMMNYELRTENWLEEIGFLPVEYRDTVTWMPFRDVHSYEKSKSGYFSIAVDTEVSSSFWGGSDLIEYYLVFDNWDNNRNTDQKAAGGPLNIELLVDVEDRLLLPKFTAYMLVAVLPLSCLIVPLIINSKYHSYGLGEEQIEETEIPILEN